MKKILSTLALGAAITTAASADMIRLEMGGGVWLDYSGCRYRYQSA